MLLWVVVFGANLKDIVRDLLISVYGREMTIESPNLNLIINGIIGDQIEGSDLICKKIGYKLIIPRKILAHRF